MSKLFAVFAVMISVATSALAGDPVSPFDSDDRTMNRAIKQAQATLPEFIRFLQSNPSQVDYASFKVAMRGTDYVEHIWVNNLKGLGKDTVRGTLNNNPNNLPGKRLGSKVTFPLTAVSDWSLYYQGKGYGSFTLRVIAKQLRGQERAELNAYLSKKPLPGLW